MHGFEHHYWRPHALRDPLRLKDSAGIFVGSMADLFGHWVPREQIDQVLEVMADAHWHTFQTLSKYPLHLPEFDFPPNVWVGVSLPAGHQMSATGAARALSAYLRHMEDIDASVRFLSIEPLWFDAAPVFERWLGEQERLPFEWAIIGVRRRMAAACFSRSPMNGPLLCWSCWTSRASRCSSRAILTREEWRAEFPVVLADVFLINVISTSWSGTISV